ncbi:MAG: hypothetical protein A2Z95_01205 [Gallionellales bacterium GWA2_60_18]|nr:MAG: hypothetical protein A2Z95_01205 [Gallionellales bacterium GWA2_60_18]
MSATAETQAPAPESAASRLAASYEHVDKEQLAGRLESVQRLLETSSAARQIESSKNPQAMALRDDARALYNTARDAYSEGSLHKANLLLNETTKMMFKAVSFAAPGEVTAKKVANDFKVRQESVQALLSAYKRIAAEKSATKGVNETIAAVEKSVAIATGLADAGKYAEGRAELDRAYATVKTGVRSLRDGDTLVRSLNFASKEEEYRYEIDRNDTHQMLIMVLLDEKRAESPGLDRQVSAFIAKARELRVSAESGAAAKDFAGAIKLLEDSTAELVRAIRNAGVYIPG